MQITSVPIPTPSDKPTPFPEPSDPTLTSRALPALLLFLDIDGVLNKAGCLGNEPHFEPSCVAALQRLIKFPDTRIVMTTSWRRGISTERFGELLAEQGIDSPVIGKTPYLTTRWDEQEDTGRGHEIQAWLEENPLPPFDPAREDAILILEDQEDLGPVRNRAYYTNPETGLTASDIPKIARLLSSQYSQNFYA